MLRTQYHNCMVSKFWAVRLERAHFWPQLLLSVNHISFLSLLMDGLSLTHLWVKHDNSCSTLFDHVRSVKAFVFFKVLCTMILVHIAQRYEQLLHVGRLC